MVKCMAEIQEKAESISTSQLSSLWTRYCGVTT